MELRRYWNIISRRLWVIVLCALIGGAISFAVAVTTVPLYTASATLMVSPASDPSGSTSNMSSAAGDFSQTYSALITTRPLLEQTIKDLHLATTPDALNSQIVVRVVRNTRLLQISVTSPSATQARDIANTLANDFIRQNEAQQLGSITDAENALKQQIADVNAQMRATATHLSELVGSQSIETAQLQFNLTQEQTTYWGLQHALTDLQLNKARIINLAQVVEPAIIGSRASSTGLRTSTATGAGLGLIVGVALAFLLEHLDETVKTPEDVQEASGLTSLGVVLRLRRGTGDVLLVGKHNPLSQFAEAYRILRTNLDFARVEHPGNALLITSGGQGEGKSTSLVNLAVALAESGRSVVAIDADLRRPSLHKAFGIDNAVGLTSLLIEEEPELGPALKSTRIDGIRVIPSGPLPPNPAELLGSNRMRRLLERLRGEADVVLIDSPPVLAVSDPIVLATVVDGVLLVVGARQTRMGDLTRARQILSQGAVHLLGVILNKASTRHGGYYYYYYHRYNSSPNGASANGTGKGHARSAGPLKRATAAASRALAGILQRD